MTFRELISTLLGDGRASNVLFTLTPPVVRERNVAVRLLYAGGVLTTFGLSLLCAATSAMLLLLSIGVIYYLMSQILGLKVDFDPTVLIHPVQRAASAPSAPN
jgi:hypothetical protein